MGNASRIIVPSPFDHGQWNNIAASYTTLTLSNQNYRVAAVIIVPPVTTISGVEFRIGTVTGTPASNSYTAGVQGVDLTTGNPDGTYKGGGTPASATFTPVGGDANSGKVITLANTYTTGATAEMLAVVCERTAATDASNCIAVAYDRATVAGNMRAGFPATNRNNGSWSKGDGIPCLGVRSSSSAEGYPLHNDRVSHAFGNTVEVGMLFNLPTAMLGSGNTYKIVGFRAYMDSPAGGSNTYIASIYQNPLSGTTASVQTSGQIDGDTSQSASRAGVVIEGYFVSPAALTAGSDYAFGIATTTGSGSNLYTMQQLAAQDFDAYPGQQLTSYTSRTNASYPPGASSVNFAAGTTTERPYIELLISDITVTGGGGGSGMLWVPDLAGT